MIQNKIGSVYKIFSGILLLILLSLDSLQAQDLEAIGKKKQIKVSGGININNVIYGIHGMKARRDPYSYFLTGNLSFNLYGWVVPFSFTLSNQNTSFRQPFNQYAIHPVYKSVTAHIGYASMVYSPYTLNGHIFRGVGIDYAPKGRFKFSAMYGRLQHAVEPDSLGGNPEAAAFRRIGFGMKASYQDKRNTLDVILFRAKDEASSIGYIPESAEVLPEENLVLSIGGSKRFFKKILWQAEFASSAISRDVRAAEWEGDTRNVYSFAGPLYTRRASSAFYSAFKSGISYKGKSYSVGAGYERVDPGYRTLGAYYFNNDLENITANVTKALLKGKLTLAANGGVQKDNLDNSKVSQMKRLVGSFNFGYSPSQHLNLTGSYSNFSTYTNIRSQFVDINQLTPYDNLDTLNYSQISQNANVNVNYIFKSKNKNKKSLNVNAAFQDAVDEHGGASSGSQFYNFNASYNHHFVPKDMGVSAVFNLNYNSMATIDALTLGPTLAVRKSFLEKKIKATSAASVNNSFTNGNLLGRVMVFRLGGNYSLKKKHHLVVNMVIQNRKNKKATESEVYTEFTGTVGYSYSF